MFVVTVYFTIRRKAENCLHFPFTDFRFPNLPDCDENGFIVRTCRHYSEPYAFVTATLRNLWLQNNCTFVMKVWGVARSLYRLLLRSTFSSGFMWRCRWILRRCVDNWPSGFQGLSLFFSLRTTRKCTKFFNRTCWAIIWSLNLLFHYVLVAITV